MNKQVSDAKIFGIQGFCKDLLEVADVLNKAVTAVPAEALQAPPSQPCSTHRQLQEDPYKSPVCRKSWRLILACSFYFLGSQSLPDFFCIYQTHRRAFLAVLRCVHAKPFPPLKAPPSPPLEQP